MEKWFLGLLICCSALVGCDAERTAKLEKENAELKAKIEKAEARRLRSRREMFKGCSCLVQ